ncbi:MAG: ATP-binding cassette, subfamily bacterial [Solirubrobacteraceae bacterium]|nr:ATP-binding cassette, subfamily bacterial [Solirubrobacteraceae bacterium]
MATFVRLCGFLRDYKRGVAWSGVLAALAMVATVAIPGLTGAAISAIQDGDRHRLRTLAIAIVVAGLLRLVLTVSRRLIAGRVSLGVEVDLRNRVYEHLLGLELGFFDAQQTGQLMSRATVDLQSVRFFLGYGLVLISQAALTVVFAAIAVIVIDPVLALVSLFPIPFVIWVAQRYGKRARPALQEVQQRIGELTADVEESVGGVRVVKAFAAEEQREQRFSESVTRVFDQSMISTRLRDFYNPFIGFLPQLGLAALLLVGGRMVVSGRLTLGEFTAFYGYLLMLLAPVRTLGWTLGLAQRATASGARLFELLDRAPRIVAAPDATPLPAGSGRVELRDVTLAYGDDPGSHAEPALRGVSMTVEAGTTIALVGATGSGKTTLVQLIPRLYDPTSGAVLVDGADVKTLDPQALRAQIAVVNDDPFLFSATVHENIAYARSDAGREEVVAAARRAQAHDFIAALPDGYDTRVGERGLTLSGGQRQRIAIARALLADPRVLILDDATSSIDASTEREIKQGLEAAMAGRTTFVIAHRLSTIALADEIAILDAGRLVDRGTHDELLKRSAFYREIVEKGLPDQVFLTRKPLEPEVAGL